MPEKLHYPILRTVGFYLIFSVLWILLSDRAIALVTTDPLLLTQIQTYKGLAFVVTSGFLIYFLLHTELKKRENSWTSYQVEREKLIERIRRSNDDIRSAHDATIEGWAKTLELRDHETAGHSDRVVDLTLRLSKAMGIPEDQFRFIRWGALLHDIGKMAIPDTILQKPGQLNPAEREVIEQHPEQGFDLLKDIGYLQSVIDIPHFHHERWDGSGYPYGLSGEEIPLTARIFSVVDVWDAMTSNRPYRLALSHQETIDYIQQQKGRHFDPKVAETFLSIIQTDESEDNQTDTSI